MRIIGLACMIVFVSGCASLSEEECLSADWHMIGFEDGSAGKTLNTIGNHREACAKVGITPLLAQYERGHLKGAEQYCTISQGFGLGDDGRTYNGVCAQVNEDEFLQAYSAGKARRELREVMDDLEDDIAEHAELLEEVETNISTQEALLINTELSKDARRRQVRALRTLHQERADILDHIGMLEYDLRGLHHQYDRLIREQRSIGYP